MGTLLIQICKSNVKKLQSNKIMICKTLFHSQFYSEPNQFGKPMIVLPDGVGLWHTAVPNGWLSFARNEHCWDEEKSLKGLSGQHMQPSQDVWLQAAFLLAHLPPPIPLPAPALVVKSLLPARGGQLLLLDLPFPLKESLSINRGSNSLNATWGSAENTKQKAACSMVSESRNLIWETGLRLSEVFYFDSSWPILLTSYAYSTFSSLCRKLWIHMQYLNCFSQDRSSYAFTREVVSKGQSQCNKSLLQQCCTDLQWNGECHIAIMGKGERDRENKRGREEKYTALQQGSKIPQSVLAEQIETITVRGIFSLVSSPPPPLLMCHKVHECSDQSGR